MRRKPQPAEFSHEVPQRELLRFRPSQTPPTTPDGRPMPEAVEWTAEDFAAFLRARAAWRDTHAEPLPFLPAHERCAMARIPGIPQALIDAESAASRNTRPSQFEQSAVVDRLTSPVFSTSEGAK